MTEAPDKPGGVRVIVVGVDGRSRVCDAAALATEVAQATGAEVMLVAVQPARPPARLVADAPPPATNRQVAGDAQPRG